jgi:kynureninase
VPVDLHASHADFAVWCSYKYLNAGPGAVAGCFVHERHAHTPRPRFAGWWGHDAATRFRMGPDFDPTPGAEGWQLSNPPILALAPLRASLDQFHRAGMARLRAKSIALTGWLDDAIRRRLDRVLDILTPSDPERRGCQLSLRVRGGRDDGRALFAHLESAGIVADWREPDVIRVAPVPLYNRYMDCARLVDDVARWAGVP